MSKLPYLAQLREKLDIYFNEEELRTLCFDLDIQYDNLLGGAKAYKARELIALLDRSDRLPQLVAYCRQKRSHVLWNYQAQFFISYKRYADTDNQLAHYLYDVLTEKGHRVFIDKTLRTGTDWLREIDRQIQKADFLVVLLSKESADSEMVQAEVKRAYDYKKEQGFPSILPIRLAYEGLLPYTIDAFLSPLQYIVWQDKTDNDQVLENILLAIQDQLPERAPIQITIVPEKHTLSEDGRFPTANDKESPPLPAFDPRFLDELIAPGGTVKLSDKFYIERKADVQLKRHLLLPGTISTIRASRQTGKSSLLIRGITSARQHKARIINFDLQRFDHEHLANSDTFLRYLAEMVSHQLHQSPEKVEKAWQGLLGAQDKLTYYLEEHVLTDDNTHIVLAMDEVDRLLDTDFHTDFFGLIRSWHNSAAYDERWEKLSIAMVISTEPYLLISDVNQSPFNVGLKLYLEDFDREQVQTLNQRHGSPIPIPDFSQFIELFSGHPYLTRKALYTLVTEGVSWPELLNMATLDQGPFSDHLRRQFWLLRDEPTLRETLKQIIRYGRSDNDTAIFRLLKSGLIKGAGDLYTCRCDLYRRYFKDKL